MAVYAKRSAEKTPSEPPIGFAMPGLPVKLIGVSPVELVPGSWAPWNQLALRPFR